jgi:hypothetical protein
MQRKPSLRQKVKKLVQGFQGRRSEEEKEAAMR